MTIDSPIVSALSLNGQRRALVLIAGAQLAVLSLWFSASAVAPEMLSAWGADGASAAVLTIPVQIGFVLGALTSSVAHLGDRIPARRLFFVSALFGSALNLGLVAVGEGGLGLAVVLRFGVGFVLAGVYPSGLKAVAGWYREGRGSALGIFIGALTVGTALPHLVRGLGLEWQGVVGAASVFAAGGSVLMLAAGDGPHEPPLTRFSWSHFGAVVRHRGFRLATAGYLGHMWELYAAWTWIGTYLAASGVARPSALAFMAIAVGGPGAWAAGRIADRKGRTVAAGGAMVMSGTMAALTAAVFSAPLWVLMSVVLVWGVTIVADSAQFSAMTTEVVPGELQGTALALQTSVGFLLTLVTIWLVPVLADASSWRWAFLLLVPGPVAGTVAMARLRSSSWAASLAGGRG